MTRTLPKFINESQMAALVTAPDLTSPEGLRDRAAMAVLCACGLRASELCGLRVRDVTPTLVFVRRGKFNRQRYVPISPAAVRAIRAYLAAYPATGDEPLFRTGPARPLTRRRLHKIVDRYALALRLPRGVHTLRHYAESRIMPSRRVKPGLSLASEYDGLGIIRGSPGRRAGGRRAGIDLVGPWLDGPFPAPSPSVRGLRGCRSWSSRPIRGRDRGR